MVSGVPGRIRDGVDKLGLLALALVADVEFGSDAYSFGKIVYRLYRCYAYYYFRTKKLTTYCPRQTLLQQRRQQTFMYNPIMPTRPSSNMSEQDRSRLVLLRSHQRSQSELSRSSESECLAHTVHVPLFLEIRGRPRFVPFRSVLFGSEGPEEKESLVSLFKAGGARDRAG